MSTTQLVLCVAFVLAACRSSERTQGAPPPSDPLSSAARPQPPATHGWTWIEALAERRDSAAPAPELARAIALAQRDSYDLAPALQPPHDADAIAGLVAWSNAHGELPQFMPPTQLDPMMAALRAVGSAAIASATNEKPNGLTAAWYLGHKLVRTGSNLSELKDGISLLEDAVRKLRQLRRPAAGWELPETDLVRMLAAEALDYKTTLDYAMTPEGRMEYRKSHPPDRHSRLHWRYMDPTDQPAALAQFYLDALDGAHRGEPPATTLDRARKAVEAAPQAAKLSGRRRIEILEDFECSLEQLRSRLGTLT